MSGFVVWIDADGAPLDAGLLRRMTEAMVPRGPDALRTHLCGGAGVGHALNAVGGDAARDAGQFSISDDLWLSGDFRFDDRETLLAALERKGRHANIELSDGELLLRAYRAFGTDCVSHLHGDFALAIWDPKRKRLFAARDRFGVKPLFYARRGHALSAGSAVDALRLLPFVSNDLDDQAMAEFLTAGMIMAPQLSAFADIGRLPPGHAMTFENGDLRTWRYWSLPVPDEIRYREPGQYCEHFREVVQRAVDDRLSGEGVGIHLSGGLDSAVLASAASQSGKSVTVRGYTVVFDRLIPDEERRFTAATAAHLGFPVEFMGADDFLPYARWGRTPEPVHDPFYFNQRTQYRDLVHHSRVALSGHGGDELMLGSYVADLVGRMPFSRLFGDLLRCLLLHGVRPPFGLRTVWRRRRRGPTPGRLPPPWIRRELTERFDLARRLGEWSADWAPSVHPLRPQAYRYFTNPAWPAVLEQEDAAFTGQPVEVRYPFFDLRVAEFLLALPPLPWCVDKHVARAAMAKRIPESVRRRCKAPLSRDVLAAHLAAPGARQVDAVTIPPALACYIDIDELPPVSRLLHSPDALWLRMAPVSLGLWLEHNLVGTNDSRGTNHDTDRPRQDPAGARETALP